MYGIKSYKIIPIEAVVNNTWQYLAQSLDGRKVYDHFQVADCIHQDLQKILIARDQENAMKIQNAVFQQNMNPRDAEKMVNSNNRYTLPAVAILYDEQNQVRGLYMPTVESIRSINPKNSGLTPPATISATSLDFEKRIISRLQSYDTQYKYPLPENYLPPLVSRKNPQTNEPVIWEHYGNTRLHKISPIKSRINKPMGGLWASAKGDDCSWTRLKWGEYVYHPDNKIVFEIKPTAKILQIDTVEAMAYLQQHYPAPWTTSLENPVNGPYQFGLPDIGVNWEAVARDYDGIYYSYDKLGNNFSIYDANSLCIFNKDAIITHERNNVLHLPETDVMQITDKISSHMIYNYVLNTNWGPEDYIPYYKKLSEIAADYINDTKHCDYWDYYERLMVYADASAIGAQNNGYVPLQDQQVLAELNDLEHNISIEFSNENPCYE